jgi:molybdenum cofactor cytidylyltransferase
MITFERSVAVLLCGGQSRRFGEADKLLHPLRGKPLVAHAAQTLASLPFAARIATVLADAPELSALLLELGYTLVPVNQDAKQADSLQAGIATALALNPESVCLALGDMPFITREHFKALADASTADRPAVSESENWLCPPWIAPEGWVRANQHALKATLQRDAVRIAAPATTLRDIDTPDDLHG